MRNIKLDELEIDKIDIVPAFNVREDFGDVETEDLQESLKATDGNIQPIIVCKKKDRYELVSGERRLRGLKATGFDKVLVIIYDNLTELQKNELMFNENLGRKHLTWQEELKALKRLQNLGFEIDTLFLKKKGASRPKIWSLLEALHAVDEYPELMNEKSRKSCILKYRKLKREEQGIASTHKISIKKVVGDNTAKNKKFNSMVIEELKSEVAHYKEKLKDIYKTIKETDQVERLSNGIWLANEVKSLIEASRTCETFGKLDEKNDECKACQKESSDVYAKCEFYRDEIGKSE